MITGKDIICELVAEDYKLAEIFKKYKIDFCSEGNSTIEDACLKRGIDPSELIRELGSGKNTAAGQGDHSSWLIDHFADYIEKKHHRYAEEKIPLIKKNLSKLCKIHGRQHPGLFEMAGIFSKITGELSIHMKREELVLFPYIREMVAMIKKKRSVNSTLLGTIQNPVRMMMYEHDAQEEQFRKISSLTGNYSFPPDADDLYRATMILLKEFEDDLHLHNHLENNILFPKALEMEKSLGLAGKQA